MRLPLAQMIRRQGDVISTKALLKDVAERWFPRSFLERRKMGFGIPVTEWLLGPMRPLVRDRLLDPTSPLFDLIRADRVANEVETFFASQGTAVPSSRIWVLLMLKLWYDEVAA
jgi:asparagine synthase (glutamine-hydrolysing)